MPCKVIECAWEGVFSLDFIHTEPKQGELLPQAWDCAGYTLWVH